MENSRCTLVKNCSFEAIQILEAPESHSTISTPPCKPKAGEVYLFDLPADKAGSYRFIFGCIHAHSVCCGKQYTMQFYDL